MGTFADLLGDLGGAWSRGVQAGYMGDVDRQRKLEEAVKTFQTLNPLQQEGTYNLAVRMLPLEVLKAQAARTPQDPFSQLLADELKRRMVPPTGSRIEAPSAPPTEAPPPPSQFEGFLTPSSALLSAAPSVGKTLQAATGTPPGPAAGTSPFPALTSLLGDVGKAMPEGVRVKAGPFTIGGPPLTAPHYFATPEGGQMVVPSPGTAAIPVPGAPTGEKIVQPMTENIAAELIADPNADPTKKAKAQTFLDTLKKYRADASADKFQAVLKAQMDMLEEIKKITAAKTEATVTGKATPEALAAATKYAEAVRKGQAQTLPPEHVGTLAEAFLTPGSPMYGKMPSMGFGAAGMPARLQFLAAVSDKMKQPGFAPTDVAVWSSVLKGLQTELNSSQNMRGKITNFMRTNDMNLALAEKISDAVERSDVPLLNRMLIPYKIRVEGAADMAGLNAAMRIAITETAKVLSSATGTGVMAKEYVDQMEKDLGATLNPKQVRRVIWVFRQDMANRETGFQSVENEVTSRIGELGRRGGGPSGQSVETKTIGGKTYEKRNGKWYER